MRRLAFFGMVLLIGGCMRLRPPAPAVVLAPDSGGPTAAWGRTLARVVDAQGRIDFAAVAADPADLDAFVGWVAATSPRRDPAQFSSRAAQLAYYLNAYNALAMYTVLHSGRLPKDKIRFFFLTGLEMGGETLSLYVLENRIIRPLGEPRVHFVLNCMVRGCPRLPREPFAADQLDAQLERETRYFLNEERNVQVDPAARRVRLSSIMKWYKSDFPPNLIEYVNRYRATPVPADYEIEFLPYDWTLNAQ